MALRWLEGFESLGVTNGNSSVGLGNKYNSGSSGDGSFTVRAGRVSGHSVQFGGGAALVTPTFSANDTWIVGFAYKQDSYSISSGNGSLQEILAWKNGGTIQCSLNVNIGGELLFYRGDQFSLLGTTSGAHLKTSVWAYIEVKVKVNSSTGTVDIKVNGTSVLSLTGQNTGSTNPDRIAFLGNLNSTDHGYFDDIYVCDNTGSNNTTFLGPQKVTAIFPTGDHGTNQWSATGAGSTHADRVKENPHDSSTTYLSDASSGDTEEFDYANTGSEITSVKGVQVNTVFETDSGAAFSVKNHVNSGGTSSDDAGTAGTNGTYTTAARLVEVDPNTSALWTKTNLDASLFGIKVA